MANKYWLKGQWLCLFCEKERDSIEHYVRECREIKKWFIEMGLEEEEILKNLWGENLDRLKERF